MKKVLSKIADVLLYIIEGILMVPFVIMMAVITIVCLVVSSPVLLIIYLTGGANPPDIDYDVE